MALLKGFGLKIKGHTIKNFRFAHAARFVLPNGAILVDSDHCSPYNTQTKRFTEAMFHAVFAAIRARAVVAIFKSRMQGGYY